MSSGARAKEAPKIEKHMSSGAETKEAPKGDSLETLQYIPV